MKRILALLICIACICPLVVACGDDQEGTTVSSVNIPNNNGGGVEDNHTFDNLRYQYVMSEYVSLPSYNTHSAEVELDRLMRDIDTLLMENATLSNRKICVMSDVVEIVYTGYLLDENGEIKQEDGKWVSFDESDAYLMYLGSCLNIPELEKGIVGMQVGEIREIYVTLPNDYSDESLRGERVMYEVILNAVYDTPTYNDSFVKKVFSDVNTTKEYEEYLKKSYVLEELYEIIRNGATVIKFPETEYGQLEGELVESEEAIKKEYGMTLDEYLSKEYSMTRDEYIKNEIKSDMVLYALAEAEGVKVTLEQLKAERSRLINYYTGYYKAHGSNDSAAKAKAIALVNDMGDHYVYENVMNTLLNRSLDENVSYIEKAATYTSVTSIIAEREKTPTGSDVGSLCPSLDLEVFDENGSLSTTVDPTLNIGKLTVINFWGTWCPYCLVELPYFDRIAREYSDSVAVFAVHSTTGYGTAPDYVLENFENSKIMFLKDYPLDKSDAYSNDTYFSKLGGTEYYPYTVILDENGIIVSTHVGAMTYESLLAALQEAGLE